MTNSPDEPKNKDIAAMYNREAAIYDESRVLVEKGYIGKKERQSITNFLKGSSILECGVGTGRNAISFGKDFTYVGCDLSYNMIKVCKEKTKNQNMDISLILSDAESLAFGEKTFDNIICSRTLKLLPSPLKFLKEARRVLKEGGRCIVTFSSLDSFWCRLYYSKIGSKIVTTDKFYPSKEIIGLFRVAGFSNIQVRPVVNVPWGIYQALWSYVIFPSQQDLIWQPLHEYRFWSFVVRLSRLTRVLGYLDPVLEKIASGIDGVIKSRFLLLVAGEATPISTEG